MFKLFVYFGLRIFPKSDEFVCQKRPTFVIVREKPSKLISWKMMNDGEWWWNSVTCKIWFTRDRAHWKTWISNSFFPIGITCDFENRWFGLVRPTFILANFNMCLLTPQGNALLWSHLVLGWVQRNSNFRSSDRRLVLDLNFRILIQT